MKLLFLRQIFLILFFFIFTIVSQNELITFDFHGKRLDDVLQKIAEIKNINILLPQEITKNEIIINFATPNLVSLDEVEEYLMYFLSMAGYILVIQDGVFIVTKKIDDNMRRYPLPLYVDVDPFELPDNPGYIRCIYFLKNLKVQGSQSVANILLNIMPEREKGIMIEPRSNCVIVTGPSNAIASAMSIILEIDQYGIKDEFEFLKLKHCSVQIVTKILEDVIAIARESNAQQGSVPYNGSTYFSSQIKIIPDIRHNAIIFLGKKNAIEKLIDFIVTEIDVPIESGKSFIHVVNLKYLDARKIAPILQSLVNGKIQSGQSIKESGTNSGYRFFDGVRIIAEEITQANVVGGENEKNKVILGGNRLLIAASKDDYEVISKIIDSIDQPQAQVIIEIMILDLEIDEQNSLSSQFRLPSIINLPKGVEFQSVMMDNSQFIINDPLYPSAALNDPKTITPNSTLKSDLFSPIGINSNSSDAANSTSFNSLADKGSRPGILISLGENFKNASIASILNLNQSIIKRNVIANPYSVTQNNVKTVIKNVSTKRGEGSISDKASQYGGATVVNIEPYQAELGIGITPRISFNKEDDDDNKNRLNLEIEINVEDFKNSSDAKNFDKLIRNLSTNAYMSSGDLLILGGLYKEGYSTTISKVPILGDIPGLGFFFKRMITSKTNTSLIIIIRPMIIADDTMKNFTRDRESFIKSELNDLALENIKDPITKFYFKKNNLMIDPFKDKIIRTNNENENEKTKRIKNIYKNL